MVIYSWNLQPDLIQRAIEGGVPYLSINSVTTYIRSAYRKIDVDKRTHAVLWGVANGFQPDTERMIDPFLRLRPAPS